MLTPFRSSLVISQPQPGAAVQLGDGLFEQELTRHYNEDETLALERLYQLKNTLVHVSDDDFWHTFCSGLARLVDAQYCVMSKRLPESSPVGEAGSCLMALCWFYDNGHGLNRSVNNMKYHAFACPCSLMSHGKVVLVPERLNETFPNNPNQLTFPAEAYLAIPLFDAGKCIAHFGLLWTEEALQRRRFGWAFAELLCHALEDIVLQRFLSGADLPQASSPTTAESAIPFEAIAALHSFKPFARNLSHELRTPMQGIVGMLDIMYSTIYDAIQKTGNQELTHVFEELRDNLETIQASAKRAIEASDNVVQAYALNMGLPDMALPTPPVDTPQVSDDTGPGLPDYGRLQSRGTKRPRAEFEPQHEESLPAKRVPPNADFAEHKEMLKQAVHETEQLTRHDKYSPSLFFSATPGQESVSVRDIVEFVVRESLKASSSSYIAPPATDGDAQRCEVVTTLSNGSKKSKVVEWIVRPSVPEFILVDERMLAKIISCVFQNALKFTDSGSVRLVVKFCLKRSYLIITIKDTGPGMPDNFKRKIFKPFAREDDSTTRQNEGLGLGLLVAKGLSRKLGGDLVLVSSDTSGTNKGCTFEVVLPIAPDGYTTHAGKPGVAGQESEVSRHECKSSSVVPNIDTSPPSPSSTKNEQPEPALPSRQDTPTDTRLLSSHHLPHSPPLSPSCETCNLSEKQTCPPAMSGKIPSQHKNQTTPEIKTPSKTPLAMAAPPLPYETPTPTKGSLSRRTSQMFDRNLATNHPLTFLVAEDNPVNRKILVSMLAKLGYDPKTQIYEAYDGVEAVKKVQAACATVPAKGDNHVKNPIDVVLMDLWMPAMDGYEATERILAMFRPRKPSAVRTMSAPNSFTLSSMKANGVPGTIESTAKGAGFSPESNATDADSSGGSSRSSIYGDCSTNNELQQQHEHRATQKTRELIAPTILAVTADATDGALEKAKSAGMEGFMVKPFRVKDLEKLIKEGWVRRERGIEARRVDVVL